MTEIIARFRQLDGTARVVERFLLISLAVVGGLWATQVHHYLPFAFFNEQYLGLFLGLGLAPVFVCVRVGGGASLDRVPWYDWLLAAGAIVVGGYVAVLYPTIAYTLGIVTWDKLLLGVLAVVLVLEGVRRLAGWALMWIALACVLYAKFAWLLPGVFYAKGSSWQRIAVYLYLDSNGIFGVPLAVTASIVVAYIFFGQALYAVGGDKFLTDVAMWAMGSYRGGPAKMAVVSSSLYGTVSGSAVANVVVDGAITIPMMKRAGYPSHLAAAIEAVSSNGGQIMPPVMGAAAFLIAEYLAIPYGQVALAAAIPAGLYYLALFVQVDLEAAKLGLAGLPREQLPKIRPVLRRGWVFLAPLAVLVWTLILSNWEAGQAGMLAVAVTFGVGALQKETRPTWRSIVETLEGTGRTMLDLVAITTLAGVVIGSLQLSGFTSKLPLLLVSMAGGNIVLLLILTAIVSIILGMSLPTTVVKSRSSSIFSSGCCVKKRIGILLLEFLRVLLLDGMRLGIVAYIVPFVFVFHPPLIFMGSFAQITVAVVTASIGVILLGVGCAGYLFRPLSWFRRTWAWVAGLLLFMPPLSVLPFAKSMALSEAVGEVLIDVLGLALGLALVLVERSATATQRTGVTEPDAPRPAHPRA
ncbi:MAG: hypothetical protein AUH30_06505 [Candidatus Rokubacteria bacterium 13_1_40CM_68_15]|nr:MAG: hypothetical protein AUH30_06505 [Candidatus Rokubacteria bacterium 13_1_40CM_68_15]